MLKKLELLTFCFSFLFVILIATHPQQGKSVLTANSLVAAGSSFGFPPAPNASLTWRMPDRFGGKDDDDLVDYHWDQETNTYAQSYLNPSGWKVDFDACASSGGSTAINSYTLEVGGQSFAQGSICRFSHQFPTLGTFPVRLTVTAQDGQSASLDTDVVVKDLLIVSIGDSYASGEGNPDFKRHGLKRARWEDGRCHRSAIAGPAQAALKIEQADPHTSVTFISLACSGAEIPFGLTGGQTKHGVTLRPQLDKVMETVNGRPIDALLISIGGNDANFADLVLRAIRLKHCDRDAATNKVLKDGLDALAGRYAELAQRINTSLRVSKVFITEYPDIVRDEDGDFCDHHPDIPDLLHGINAEEAQWAAEKVVGPLNELVKAAAELHQWIYVGGIASEFRTHGYCADDKRWARTFNDSWKVQGDQFGTAHPNAEGHAAYAKRLVEELQSNGVFAP